MTHADILQHVGGSLGWTTETRLGLVLDYLDQSTKLSKDTNEFVNYLLRVVNENEPTPTPTYITPEEPNSAALVEPFEPAPLEIAPSIAQYQKPPTGKPTVFLQLPVKSQTIKAFESLLHTVPYQYPATGIPTQLFLYHEDKTFTFSIWPTQDHNFLVPTISTPEKHYALPADRRTVLGTYLFDQLETANYSVEVVAAD